MRTSSRSWVQRFELRGAWPFVSAAEVEERFEQLVHRRWWTSGAREAGGHTRPLAAPADVFVVDGEIWVEVDLPGIAPETLRVQVERGDLLIEAERHPHAPSPGARAATVERPRGWVRRRVSLPLEVGRAQLEQRFEDGILQVRIRPEGARS